MKTRFYCFGNPLVKEDRLPIDIIGELKEKFPDFEFIAAESPDEIEGEKSVNIIDSAIGIKDVKLITDLDSICVESRCSLHDYDLAMTLKIMKKIGILKEVKIIAIPINFKRKKAVEEVSKIIKENW